MEFAYVMQFSMILSLPPIPMIIICAGVFFSRLFRVAQLDSKFHTKQHQPEQRECEEKKKKQKFDFGLQYVACNLIIIRKIA